MQDAAADAITWAEANNMKLNASKTNELLIYFGKSDNQVPSIIMEGEAINRVHSAKLLGVNISDKLDWDVHVASINSKASKRLFYLRQLKRSGLCVKDLVTVFLSMIRPVSEYACQVWSTSLTQANIDLLESIQKRALKIISPALTYKEALDLHQLPTLVERRTALCRELFKAIMTDSEHRLHCLLPPPRESRYSLREHKQYPLPRINTKRFKNSFINWGLFNCQ